MSFYDDLPDPYRSATPRRRVVHLDGGGGVDAWWTLVPEDDHGEPQLLAQHTAADGAAVPITPRTSMPARVGADDPDLYWWHETQRLSENATAVTTLDLTNAADPESALADVFGSVSRSGLSMVKADTALHEFAHSPYTSFDDVMALRHCLLDRATFQAEQDQLLTRRSGAVGQWTHEHEERHHELNTAIEGTVDTEDSTRNALTKRARGHRWEPTVADLVVMARTQSAGDPMGPREVCLRREQETLRKASLTLRGLEHTQTQAADALSRMRELTVDHDHASGGAEPHRLDEGAIAACATEYFAARDNAANLDRSPILNPTGAELDPRAPLNPRTSWEHSHTDADVQAVKNYETLSRPDWDERVAAVRAADHPDLIRAAVHTQPRANAPLSKREPLAANGVKHAPPAPPKPAQHPRQVQIQPAAMQTQRHL